MKSVYRNVVREKNCTCLHCYPKLLVCAVTKGWLVFFLPQEHCEHVRLRFCQRVGANPLACLLQERTVSSGDHTAAVSHWSREVGSTRQKRTTLCKANPQLIESSLWLWRPASTTPQSYREAKVPKSKWPAQTHPLELELAPRFLKK